MSILSVVASKLVLSSLDGCFANMDQVHFGFFVIFFLAKSKVCKRALSSEMLLNVAKILCCGFLWFLKICFLGK